MKPKETTITFGANGFEFRAKNKRVRVIELPDKGGFTLQFAHYIGENKITAITENVRGIALTKIDISEETILAICQGIFHMMTEREMSKTKKPDHS
jgi:hypothetical protein